jgi:hypothetical protein
MASSPAMSGFIVFLDFCATLKAQKSHFDDLKARVDSRSSFPILVASLALIVGGLVIANSVALSTLERRREIGIMKTVGLQRVVTYVDKDGKTRQRHVFELLLHICNHGTVHRAEICAMLHMLGHTVAFDVSLRLYLEDRAGRLA